MLGAFSNEGECGAWLDLNNQIEAQSTIFRDMKRRVIATAALLTAMSYIAPATIKPAQAQERQYCYSELADRAGEIEYGECIPHFLSINKANKPYAQYMSAAIELAAEESDWNSAIINFQRAKQQAKTKFELAEAERGELAATFAKTTQPQISDEGQHLGYVSWVRISGCRSSKD